MSPRDANPGRVPYHFRNPVGSHPAEVRGFEAEYTINPIEGLLVNGSVG